MNVLEKRSKEITKINHVVKVKAIFYWWVKELTLHCMLILSVSPKTKMEKFTLALNIQCRVGCLIHHSCHRCSSTTFVVPFTFALTQLPPQSRSWPRFAPVWPRNSMVKQIRRSWVLFVDVGRRFDYYFFFCVNGKFNIIFWYIICVISASGTVFIKKKVTRVTFPRRHQKTLGARLFIGSLSILIRKLE